MKFTSVLLSLSSLASLTHLANAQNDNALITAVLGDIKAHVNDYLSYIQEGHAPPSGVLNLYQQVQTYTDDSYTTLFSQLDANAVSTYVTALPWYSSRLESAIGGGAAETSAASSAPASSSVAETSAASSSAPVTSSSAPAAASSSSVVVVKSSSAPESSAAAASSSTVAVAVSEGAGSSLKGDHKIAFLIVPFVLALGSPMVL